jgi:MFS family permease
MFGRPGDLIGREYTFLATILLIGGSTFLVGLLPTYYAVGAIAPFILITLRLLQCLAMGGGYGGAPSSGGTCSRRPPQSVHDFP